MSSRAATSGLKKKKKKKKNEKRKSRSGRNPKKGFAEMRSKGGVEERLQVLKELIHGEGEMKADMIFKETADYIVFLRAQVHILQGLVDFYASDDKDLVLL